MRSLPILVALCAITFTWESRAEVPLHWDSTGHVVVPTLINGTGPVDFIFDTGADETSVFAWLAKQLNLPSGGSGEISGATGSATTALSRVSMLSVDAHEIKDLSALTIPDRPDAPKLGGIVGVELMMGRLAVLDFGCGTAALLPLTSSKSIYGRHAQMVHAGSIPDGQQLTLPVRVNGAVGIALLDSGARSTIINWKLAAAAGLDPRSDAFRDGEPARGATRKAIDSREGPIGTVKFAGITRTKVTARVVDLPGLTDNGTMILGLDLLRGTRLSVDYSGRRFWLAPSQCTSRSEPGNR